MSRPISSSNREVSVLSTPLQSSYSKSVTEIIEENSLVHTTLNQRNSPVEMVLRKLTKEDNHVNINFKTQFMVPKPLEERFRLTLKDVNNIALETNPSIEKMSDITVD